MNKLVFLDTETTGNDVLQDRLFQVCYSYKGDLKCEYFKPPIPITVKSQSITHVTNKMVAEKRAFEGSKMQKDLRKLLKDNILVAHNAAFDICMLSKEGVEVPQFICTLRVARFLDEECKVPEYNLQFLRYFLELEIEADAHDAMGDVLVLEALFQRLYQKMVEKYGDSDMAITKMIEISNQPTLFRIINFGKYKGRKLEEIITIDRGYTEWLLEQKMQNEAAEEDWIFTLKYYLEKK